jgi:hypothetical protein
MIRHISVLCLLIGMSACAASVQQPALVYASDISKNCRAAEEADQVMHSPTAAPELRAIVAPYFQSMSLKCMEDVETFNAMRGR